MYYSTPHSKFIVGYFPCSESQDWFFKQLSYLKSNKFVDTSLLISPSDWFMAFRYADQLNASPNNRAILCDEKEFREWLTGRAAAVESVVRLHLCHLTRVLQVEFIVDGEESLFAFENFYDIIFKAHSDCQNKS